MLEIGTQPNVFRLRDGADDELQESGGRCPG
jgi:hypothetical protein